MGWGLVGFSAGWPPLFKAMAQTVTLNSVDYTIPDPGEKGYGANLTAYLVALGAATTGDSVGTAVATAGSTVSPSSNIIILSAASAVSLSGTTAISDGSNDGQLLELVGTSDTNTVQVPDGANTNLNGDVILGAEESITLRWNDTDSEWVERTRST